MSVPEKFKGYGSFSKDEPTALKLFEFTPKKFEDHDVDIKITHCGVCSDRYKVDPCANEIVARFVEVTFTLCGLDG
jgi:hypothetical protein